MSLVRLNIKGISYSQTQSGAYALVLSEVDGSRTLPIVIGAFEAQSIAIALATRFNAPIYTYENILDKAGIYLKAKDELTDEKDTLSIEKLVEEPEKVSSFSKDTLEELNEKLSKAVLNEDYELAAKIRDEITKRTS